MTISSTSSRVVYTGNGVTTAFSYPWYFQATSDLVVVETVIATGVQTTKTLNSDYVVSGTQDANGFYENGGTVTATAAPASTVAWSIFRDPPETQTTAFVDNDPLPAATLEAVVDKLTTVVQRVKNLISRAMVQPDGDIATVGPLPPKVTRANGGLGSYAGYDSNGDPTTFAVANGGTSVPVSTAMAPVVEAASLAAGRTAFGLGSIVTQDADALTGLTITNSNVLTNTRLAKTANYTVLNADKGSTLALSGGLFTLSLGDPADYDANFQILIINEDTWTAQGSGTQGRAKNITTSGFSFRLWPYQSIIALVNNGAWAFCPGVNPSQYSGMRWKVPGQITVFVDSTDGDDSNDGMATGTGGALKTITAAFEVLYKSIDHNNFQNGLKLADGNYPESIQLFGCPVGSNVIFLEGNTTTPTNVSWTCPAASLCLLLGDGATTEMKGLQFATLGSGSTAIEIHQTSICDLLEGVVFAPFSGGTHIFMDHGGGSMNADVGYTVTGGANVHVHVGPGCFYNLGGTLTLTGTPAFPTIFEGYGAGSQISLNSALVISGTATGQKYNLNMLAGMDGGGLTLPGNTDGAVANGATFKA